MQKYYIVAADYCYPMPDSMTAEEGALVEPVAVAVQICKVADLRAGQTVLVFGCGPIGVLCQAVAKGYGAKKVIGVDISESRAAFAETFGADGVFVSKRSLNPDLDPVEAVRENAEKILKQFGMEGGADVVLECTGAEPCIQAGIFAAKKGGTYVQAGMGKEVQSPSRISRHISFANKLVERRLSHHHCLYPGTHCKGLHPIHDWLLPCRGRIGGRGQGET